MKIKRMENKEGERKHLVGYFHEEPIKNLTEKEILANSMSIRFLIFILSILLLIGGGLLLSPLNGKQIFGAICLSISTLLLGRLMSWQEK